MKHKIWLLSEQKGVMFITVGAVSSKVISKRWCNLKPRQEGSSSYNFRQEVELDSLELLQRIAKGEINEQRKIG